MAEDRYFVHCVNCGKEMQSDEMGIDVSEILKRYFARFPLKQEKFKEIYDMDFGIYLTAFELNTIFKLEERKNILIITLADLRKYVERKYQMDLKKALEHGDVLLQYSQRIKNNMNESTDIDTTILFKKIKSFFECLVETDEDEDEEGNIYLDEDSVVMRCHLNFLKDKDDKGNGYIVGVKITFEDSSRTSLKYMVCTACGEQMSAFAGKHKEIIIGMLGSSGVGKTAYLAALFAKIKPKVGQNTLSGIDMVAISDDRWKNFEKNILRKYEEGKKIPKTIVNKMAVPLFTSTLKIGWNQESKLYNFTFVDMPGEVLVKNQDNNSEDFVINNREIFNYVDLFWFCIDPYQIDGNLSSTNQGEVDIEFDLVITGIMDTLRDLQEANREAAVILTKCDLIKQHEESLFQSLKELTENKFRERLIMQDKFFVDIFEANEGKVKEYFTERSTVKNIKTDLDVMFKHYHYFAIAAYGNDVLEQEELQVINPIQIEELFYWSLAVLGILKPCRKEIKRSGSFWNKKEEIIDKEVSRDKLFV